MGNKTAGRTWVGTVGDKILYKSTTSPTAQELQRLFAIAPIGLQIQALSARALERRFPNGTELEQIFTDRATVKRGATRSSPTSTRGE